MAGVEVAQLSRFQRPGAYPNHEADGFFFFWIACAAMACFFLGAAIYYWLLISPKKRFILRLILGATAVALLGCSSWYGIWYHAVGLPRIAPDFAEAGFQSDWFDWVEAAALLTILVTAASFRIAGDQTRTVGLEDRTGIEKPVFYESFSIVLIFAGIAALFPLEFLISVFSDWSGVGVSFSELFYYVATTIEYYFPIAIYLLILQIIWLRWRHGPAQKAYYLPVISGRKMAIAWLSLMLFAIIGIPTISAFCFSFWLGPWYLL